MALPPSNACLPRRRSTHYKPPRVKPTAIVGDVRCGSATVAECPTSTDLDLGEIYSNWRYSSYMSVRVLRRSSWNASWVIWNRRMTLRGIYSGAKDLSEFGLGRSRDLRPGASSLCSKTITRSTRILRISKRRLNCNATELDKSFFSRGGTGPPGQEQRRSITLRMMGVVFSNDSRRMYSLG